MKQVQATLTDAQVADLMEIARRRGVNANTVIQQAIGTEKLISDNVRQGDDLIIRKADNTAFKVEFGG